MKKIVMLALFVQSVIADAQMVGVDLREYYRGVEDGKSQAESTIIINPKYSLQEAIDIAIADLEARHQEVKYSTLKRRVEKMPKGDVYIGEKNEFRQAIRWAIEKYEIKSKERISAQYTAPTPKGMKQDEFIEAYFTYMQQTLSPSEATKIKGLIDGMRGYNRAMKNEAIKLWRAANSK